MCGRMSRTLHYFVCVGSNQLVYPDLVLSCKRFAFVLMVRTKTTFRRGRRKAQRTRSRMRMRSRSLRWRALRSRTRSASDTLPSRSSRRRHTRRPVSVHKKGGDEDLVKEALWALVTKALASSSVDIEEVNTIVLSVQEGKINSDLKEWQGIMHTYHRTSAQGYRYTDWNCIFKQEYSDAEILRPFGPLGYIIGRGTSAAESLKYSAKRTFCAVLSKLESTPSQRMTTKGNALSPNLATTSSSPKITPRSLGEGLTAKTYFEIEINKKTYCAVHFPSVSKISEYVKYWKQLLHGNYEAIFGDLQGRWIVGKSADPQQAAVIGDIWYSSLLMDLWQSNGYNDSRNPTGVNDHIRPVVTDKYNVKNLEDSDTQALSKTSFQSDSALSPYYCSYELDKTSKELNPLPYDKKNKTRVGYCDCMFYKGELEDTPQHEVSAVPNPDSSTDFQDLEIWDKQDHHGFAFKRDKTMFVSFNLGGKNIKRREEQPQPQAQTQAQTQTQTQAQTQTQTQTQAQAQPEEFDEEEFQTRLRAYKRYKSQRLQKLASVPPEEMVPQLLKKHQGDVRVQAV